MFDANNNPQIYETNTACPGGLLLTLSNGYVNNETLTREKFIPINNKLFYMTGDYSHILANGKVTILARQNRLVPSQKKNIFLKDIEDQFLINTNAKECAAIFVPDKNGKGTIRIYYSTGDDQSIIKSSITNYTSLCNIEYIKIPFIPLHPTSAKVHYSKLSYMNEV